MTLRRMAHMEDVGQVHVWKTATGSPRLRNHKLNVETVLRMTVIAGSHIGERKRERRGRASEQQRGERNKREEVQRLRAGREKGRQKGGEGEQRLKGAPLSLSF